MTDNGSMTYQAETCCRERRRLHSNISWYCKLKFRQVKAPLRLKKD